MKAVILAGGLGTRLGEETSLRPKPMVEIGGKPILWHIMKIYASHGVNDFIICTGYKGYMIKEYFANYWLHMSDVTFNMKTNSVQVHHNHAEPWTVTVLDTGAMSLTGGRLKRVASFLENEDAFCFTYGDGVSDVDITQLLSFHKSHGKDATVTVVRPPGRYGAIKFKEGSTVDSFVEKPEGTESWINGGFFVLSPRVLSRIKDDETSWEGDPLTSLAADGQLMAFKHDGFWQPMDTLREKTLLNQLWESGRALWKKW